MVTGSCGLQLIKHRTISDSTQQGFEFWRLGQWRVLNRGSRQLYCKGAVIIFRDSGSGRQTSRSPASDTWILDSPQSQGGCDSVVTRQNFRIAGSGRFLPPLQVGADEIDSRLGMPSGWTRRSTGVETRYECRAPHSILTMGAEAIQSAMHQAGGDVE